MASGQKNSVSQPQSPVDTINEDEFDIHVVAYRSFQQIFVPRGLAKLEKILESWAAETEMESHDRLVKRLERKPSGRIGPGSRHEMTLYSKHVRSSSTAGEVEGHGGHTGSSRERLLRTG